MNIVLKLKKLVNTMRKEILDTIEKFKTVRKEIVPPRGFITTLGYECHLKCGKVVFREKLLKGMKDGSASIIVPMTMSNNILVVVEPRVHTSLTVGVGFPAGYIENDEDIISGAKRELLEETGYQADDMIHLDEFYQDEGCSAALNHIFLATNCIKVSDQNLDKDEFIKYFECSYDEVLELANLGYINGGNSKLALEKIKKYVRR